MYAHFHQHVYPLHAHETYSFGVTEEGAQQFRCRGGRQVSAAGMVMAFNPEDPHDGRAVDGAGYHYRMLHISEEVVREVLREVAGRVAGLPLFAEPVVHDPGLAEALRGLCQALVRGDRLAADERLVRAVLAMVHRCASRGGGLAPGPAGSSRAGRSTTARIAERACSLLLERPTEQIGAAELAAAAGCSRYVLYRAFRATYGLAPSDYHRQLRLRQARRLIADGYSLAEAASLAGFADQAHFTRWFSRTYGITPATYRGTPGGSDRGDWSRDGVRQGRESG